MRDAQRHHSYTAEGHVFEDTLLAERCSFDSLVAQTRAVEATPEWQAHFGRPVVITRSRGSRSHAGGLEIAYTDIALRKTVPHEMAHLLSPSDPGHGHQWRSCYVWVVRLAYGDQWAEALAAAYRGSKLSFETIPLARTTPVFPPVMFAATVGTPMFNKTNNDAPARGPIAL